MKRLCPADATPQQRHSAHTDKSGGADACWPWKAYRNKAGYGLLGVGRGTVLAHRAAFIFAVGPFPTEMKVLHRCDNPACQNPAHLFLGTQVDNMADMRRKGRERKAPGESNGSAKLTALQVAAIRADPRSQSAIAMAYGVVQTTISKIKLGKIWSGAKRGIPLKEE